MSEDEAEAPPKALETALNDIFFRPAHWQSAYDVAVQRLAQAIKLGALEVGSRLPAERELVVSLGISRTTLREAIRTLQEQGYVTSTRGRTGGTFVASRKLRKPTRAELRRTARELGDALPNLIDLREAAEPTAAELAARRATDEDLSILRWLVRQSKAAHTLELRQTDSILHIAIARSARSDLLLDLVLEVQIRLHDLLAFLPIVPDLSPAAHESTIEHGDIVGAIERRDPETARRLMSEHIKTTHDLIRSVAGFQDPVR